MLEIKKLALAPYLQKATALRGARRRVGGNQFRHQMATLAILIDHHEIDPVVLKASLIHDLLEDMPQETNLEEIRRIDEDGEEVVELMLEVTRRPEESKREYLQRLVTQGSKRAKILKFADRISNLTDLNIQEFSADHVTHYLNETEEWILPLAPELNANMAKEIHDLIARRRQALEERGYARQRLQEAK
jgi:GTP pyrophosphokinase